ncbi:hypothetical protein B0H67DRAFT_75239 [Lasiosphaeris hirsuta]|uniref:Uncharacterized protein n=1 Tax=Lasiosphaeris hirsuta TaxID=260670 RepID=A0AA40BC09_9PEZI|nr:hypothetical protein B0H67DRAFT_75239 [Lasiosphaeris hirsuta]
MVSGQECGGRGGLGSKWARTTTATVTGERGIWQLRGQEGRHRERMVDITRTHCGVHRPGGTFDSKYAIRRPRAGPYFPGIPQEGWVKSEPGRETLPGLLHAVVSSMRLTDCCIPVSSYLEPPAILGPSSLDSHWKYLRQLAGLLSPPGPSDKAPDRWALLGWAQGCRPRCTFCDGDETATPGQPLEPSCAGSSVDIWRSGERIRHLSRRSLDAPT